jgi:hypothetical protein
MLFNDQQGLVIDISQVFLVQTVDKEILHVETSEEEYYLQLHTVSGIQIVKEYASQEQRDAAYERLCNLLQIWHDRHDEFDLFMKQHAREGAEWQKRQATKEDRGW